MPLDLFIARWVAVLWLMFGLSHLLHPARWAALLMPLRERDTGGFLLASFNLPLGLLVVLGHNIWVWDLPVIVTVAGWMTIFKSTVYLLFPRTHARVMTLNQRPEKGFRVIGAVLMVLGALVAYDAFCRR
jgi:uncharacterized protein YjeT (DUF2065 family)